MANISTNTLAKKYCHRQVIKVFGSMRKSEAENSRYDETATCITYVRLVSLNYLSNNIMNKLSNNIMNKLSNIL
jgi:hypothetical protein